MIPFWLFSDSTKKAMREQHEREVEQRLQETVPWSPTMKWTPELNLQADTFKMLSLFDVEPLPSNDVRHAKNGNLAVSPTGKWGYCEKVFPRGHMLRTVNGSKKGSVLFDGDVLIPTIHECYSKDWGTHLAGSWREDPWMSLTPMEVMTLRGGTRRAKAKVIMAGLGMGHQLIEVSKRKKVKHLTLVEKDQELVDWILPRIQPSLGRDIDEIVIGDAYEELPKMAADVALVDIFPTYGNNDMERDRLREDCRGIDYVWVWGSAVLP